MDKTDSDLIQQILAPQSDLYYEIFETAMDGICILDHERNFLAINQAIVDLTGYSKEELLKMNVKDLVYGEDQEKSARYFSELTQKGHYWHYVGRMVSKTGRIILVQVNSNQLRYQDRIIGYRDVVRDISSSVALEKSLQSRSHRMKRVYNLLKKFQKAMLRDLDMSEQIHRALLKKNYRLDPDVQCHIHYRPLDKIGGDYYDINTTKPGFIRLFLADATGHGVQAAMITMLIHHEYRKIRNKDLTPAELISLLNESFYADYYQIAILFSCIIIDIDIINQVLTYSSAGHPPQFFFTDQGPIISLTSKGKLVGLSDDRQYRNASIMLKNKFNLVLFTDGLFEQINDFNRFFGIERIHKSLESRKENSLKIIFDSIIEDLALFMNVQPLQDDVTVIVLGNQ